MKSKKEIGILVVSIVALCLSLAAIPLLLLSRVVCTAVSLIAAVLAFAGVVVSAIGAAKASRAANSDTLYTAALVLSAMGLQIAVLCVSSYMLADWLPKILDFFAR